MLRYALRLHVQINRHMTDFTCLYGCEILTFVMREKTQPETFNTKFRTRIYIWRIKDQVDVTCYFISLLMCSKCFGHSYILHQELATVLLNYHMVVLFLFCCVLEFWCGWVGVVAGWSLQHGYHPKPATPKLQHTTNQEHTTDVVIQQNSRRLLMMDVLMSETCWAHKKWNKIASDIKLVFNSSTITMMRGPINIRIYMSNAYEIANEWRKLNLWKLILWQWLGLLNRKG